MRALVVGSVLAASLVGHSARADNAASCTSAYEAGQRELKVDAHLLQARKDLMTCSQSTCPPIIAQECTSLLAELERQQPTLVVVTHDEHGQDVADVRVLSDGVVIVTHVDGKPLPIDPGAHRLRFELTGHVPIEQNLIVHVGEKDREVRADFRLPSVAVVASQPTQGSRWLGVPASAIVIGSIGVLSLGAWGVLGLTGLARESSLFNSCIHGCTPSDVSSLELQYNIADVTMVVGFVALAVAVVLTAAHRGRAATPRAIALVF
jgi:hypothetical protein